MVTPVFVEQPLALSRSAIYFATPSRLSSGKTCKVQEKMQVFAKCLKDTRPDTDPADAKTKLPVASLAPLTMQTIRCTDSKMQTIRII